MKVESLTDGLIKLTQKYSFTPRAIVTEERYRGLVESDVLEDWTYDTEAIREPLIEHVGHLPIIATYMHQHIEHKNEVDLGRALTMLAVHDIGETEVGDVFAFSKTESHEQAELEAAKKLLPDYLFEYFEEYDRDETMDGKFAYTVDKIAPVVHELLLPDVTLNRFKHYSYNTDQIVIKKKEYFEWDSVLKEMFEYMVEKYRKMEV